MQSMDEAVVRPYEPSEPTDQMDQINVDDVLMEYFGPSLEQLQRDHEEKLRPQGEAILDKVDQIWKIGEEIDQNATETFYNVTQPMQDEVVRLSEELLEDGKDSLKRASSLEQLRRDHEEKLRPQGEAILDKVDQIWKIGEDIHQNATDTFYNVTQPMQDDVARRAEELLEDGKDSLERAVETLSAQMDGQDAGELRLMGAAAEQSSSNVATGVGAGLVGMFAGYAIFKLVNRNQDDSSYKRVDQPLL